MIGRHSLVFWEIYFPTNARLLQQYITTKALLRSGLSALTINGNETANHIPPQSPAWNTQA